MLKFPNNFEVKELLPVSKIDFNVMFKRSMNDDISAEDFEKLLKVAEKGLTRLTGQTPQFNDKNETF